MKYLEMQLNKQNKILNKAKIVIIKVDKIFLVLQYTYAKIELRMRNLMNNSRDTINAISHFMNFYLVNKQFYDHLMLKYIQHIKHLQELEYESQYKISKTNRNQASFVNSSVNIPQMNTNYSYNQNLLIQEI